MFRKMLLIGTFVVLSGILLLGAVNRTQARSAQTTGGGHGAAQHEVGQGGGGSVQAAVAARTAAQSGSGQGQGQGQGGGRGQGQGHGQGGGRGPGNGSGEPPVAHDWRTVAGSVGQMDDTTMTVLLADDTSVLMEGRPWRYVLEQGFGLSLGDQVTLLGFDEDGEFKVGQLTNDTLGGATLELRDADGRPAWRGQGNR